MSRHSSNLPDAKYLAFVDNALKICRDHLLLYKIPEKDYEQVEALYEKAKLAFEANSLTKNEDATRETHTAFQNLKSYMNWFGKTLETNLNVPDKALQAMGLPSRHPEHHSQPAPTEKGVVSFKWISILLRIYLDLPTHDSERKRRSPMVANGTDWEVTILDSGAIKSFRSTKSFLNYIPKESDRGKTLRVRGRWVNKKLEPGPWSEWFEYIIN